jgi:dephospho-CoA kinase
MKQHKQLLISVFSKMRGGKDTAAKYIMSKSYNRFPSVKLAYGDELKRLYHEIFGHSDDVAKDRDGYQWFGQKMRERDSDIWIKKVNPSLLYYKAKNYNIVFTDMRQPNEYEHLKRHGFVMVKIECPDELRIQRMEEAGEEVKEEYLNHETEQYIDTFEYDFIVHNDDTLEHLYKQLDEVMEAIINA